MRIPWLRHLPLIVLLAVSELAARDVVQVTARLDEDTHTITGRLSTIVSNLSPELTELHFRLYPNRFCDSAALANNECGLVIDSLFVNGANRRGDATVAATDLSVLISYETLTDRELAIESFFTLKLPHCQQRFGYFQDRTVLEAWLPVLAPRDDSGWLVIDYQNRTVEPVGDAVDFDLRLSVPRRLSLVAPGIVDSTLTDSLAEYHIILRDAAHVPVVIATGFLSDVKMTDGVKHTVYFSPGNRFVVDSIQAWVAYTLAYMSEHVYPFPKDEVLVVVGALNGGGGLEHPQMIWLREPSPVSVALSPRTIVVHEIIHQWFFYLVNSNQSADPWLDESVTEYFTIRVLKEMTGGTGHFFDLFGVTVSFDLQNRIVSDRMFSYTPINVPAGDINNDDLYSLIYAKGSDLVATMTAQMGEQEDRFWRTFVERNLFARPTPESFYALAEQFTRGTEPGRVKSLLTTLHRPDYRVEEITSRPLESFDDSLATSEDSVESTITIAVTDAIPFPMAVRIVLESGAVVDTAIAFETGRHTLTRVDVVPVVGVILDPDRRVRIDDNYLNNSLFTRPMNSSGQRVLSVLTFLVESLYSILWGL